MIDYKRYNKESFHLLVKEIIDKKFKGKFEFRDITDKVKLIIEASTSRLDGKSFFKIAKILNEDLTSICKQFFKDLTVTPLTSLSTTDSKVKNLLNSLFNSRKQLSESTGIKESRLGEILNKEVEEIYACEIYAIALATRLEPKDLFEYFYGEGEKPIIGVK